MFELATQIVASFGVIRFCNSIFQLENSSLLKADLHLAYKKLINVSNNTVYISVNKHPSNKENNKTEYLIVRQNKHVAIRLYITYMGN